jgi:DNA-binding transcriptional LysR family regulator
MTAPFGMNVNLKQIRAFVAVAQLGSFTSAANLMRLSQPALTVIIRKLEDAVGVSLFDRTTRRVVLSDQGRDFLPIAERLLKDFELAIEDIRAVAEHRRGRVAISALFSVAVVLLPPPISAFAKAYPAISIRLRDDNSGAVRRSVRLNEVDFGFASMDEEDRELDFTPVLRDQMGIVARHDHPLMKRRRRLRWSDIEGYPFLGLGYETGVYSALQDVKNLPEAVRTPQYEISSTATVEAIIESGLGLTVLPALAITGRKRSALEFRPVSEPTIVREVCLIKRRGRSLSPAAGIIQSMILDRIAQFCRANPLVESLAGK